MGKSAPLAAIHARKGVNGDLSSTRGGAAPGLGGSFFCPPLGGLFAMRRQHKDHRYRENFKFVINQ